MEKNQLIDIIGLKKQRINKILIFIVVATSVVIASVIGAIIVVNSKKNIDNLKVLSNNEVVENKVENIIQKQEESEVEQIDNVQKEADIPIPIYSEEAKQKVLNIYHAQDEEKTAYLTFDDGPSNTVTPQILDILRNENIKATFFVLGSRVKTYPEIVEQEYEEGHYIANHGYSHVYGSVYASPQAVLDEYNVTEQNIKEVLGDGYSSHLFRFPGGSEGGKYAQIKNEAKSLLEANNVVYVNWNALTNDSVGKPTHESLIANLKSTSNGKQKIVVLMHDTGAKQLTADTLPEVISYLREQGYVFRNFYDIFK